MREIESLLSESDALSDSISQLNDRVGNLELETSASVRTLSELAVIKKRMDSCSSVLQQADRFRIQLRSMDDVYESGNVAKMSAALSSLVSSFSSLSNLSEFEGDKALVLRYTERLEALVKPKMIESFEKHDTPQALACIATFRQIERSDQIALIYHKYFNQKVSALWQKYDFSLPGASSGSNASYSHLTNSTKENTQIGAPTATLGTKNSQSSFSKNPTPSPSPLMPTNSPSTTPLPSQCIDNWISTYFEELTPLLSSEIAWIPNVFPDAAPAIAKLLIAALTQISTLFDFNLRKLDISVLADVYQRTKKFASLIDPLVAPLGAGLRFQVFQALFAPFRKYQLQYSSLESHWLWEKYSDFESTTPPLTTPDAIINTLNARAEAVFAHLHCALDHCIQFTEAAEAANFLGLATAKIYSLLNLAESNISAMLAPMLVASIGTTISGSHLQSSSSASLQINSPLIADSLEWKEELFLKAIDATKTAATVKNLFENFVAVYRAKVMAQKTILFGDQSLQQVIETENRTTTNLFLYQGTEEVKKLAQLFIDLEQPDRDLMSSCTAKWLSMTSSTQFIVFESMFKFIRHQMMNFTKLPQFVREGATNASPAAQSYIKQIVEHFLVLPQALEALESESDEETAFLSLPIDPFAVNGRPKYFGIAPSLLLSKKKDDAEAEEETSGFSSLWMEIVAQETQLLLASNILQLAHITNYGVDQLEADILHLFSVLSVLSLKQEPILELLLQYCRVPSSDFATLLADTNDLEHKKMLILLGRSRRVLPSSK